MYLRATAMISEKVSAGVTSHVKMDQRTQVDHSDKYHTVRELLATTTRILPLFHLFATLCVSSLPALPLTSGKKKKKTIPNPKYVI